MSSFPPKSVEVAVTVIRRGDRILAGYNSNWGSFTLPMTKRRRWASPDDPQMIRDEPWEEAAARNVVECFGRTLVDEPKPLMEVKEFRQSDRDLVVKQYHFAVYEVGTPDDLPLFPGVMGEWLLPEQFLDVRRRPVSPTARYLLGELQKSGKLS